MGYQKKVIAIVLVLIAIMVFLAFWLPNHEVSGNKNVVPLTSSEVDPKHTEEVVQEEEASKESTATAVASEAKVAHPNFQFTFTAFKTPQKAPVSGTFDNIEVSKVKEGKTISESLTGANFMIPTSSVNTKDPSGTRDPKLREFFFDKMSSPTINGEFKSFQNGTANVSITMNGVTKDIPMTYTETDNSLDLKGKIDIVSDFKANTALASIAEACKDLHANKTWSEVDLEVKFSK